MIDIGLSKIVLISAVALVVIGPERLPKVARMAGTLFGRAQRYMNDVRNEVSRQMEQEELRKVKEAATDAFKSVQDGIQEVTNTVQNEIESIQYSHHDVSDSQKIFKASVRQGKASWGNRRGVIPVWFKHSTGIKTRVQSGAARVKRFRRAASQQRGPRSFF